MIDSMRGCVLLADRHAGLMEGVRGLLETTFSSIFLVSDEASLLEGAERLLPLLVIVDVSLAQGDLLGLVREVANRSPASKILVLSVHDEPCVARAALSAGAHAVVLKRAIVTDLLPAIDALLGT